MTEIETAAGAREWTGLAVLVLPCLVVSMGSNVLHLALPEISGALRPTNEQLLWVVDGYVFLLAGSLMTMGALADRIGRRRLLLLGGGAYGVLSLVAALSTTPEMLIVARMLLGVAGATLMPSTLSLIRSMFHDPRQRTTALGVWTASFALGGVIGPLVGGVLLGAFWWGSVFSSPRPSCSCSSCSVRGCCPSSATRTRTPVDVRSAGLSLVSVLLRRLRDHAARRVGPGPAAAGRARRRDGRRRRLPRASASSPHLRAGALPAPGIHPAGGDERGRVLRAVRDAAPVAQYLQLVLGLSPLEAGLWTIPSALGYLLGSAMAPHVADRLRPGAALGAGLLVSAAGFALLVARAGRRRAAAVRRGVGHPVGRPGPGLRRRHRAGGVGCAGAAGRDRLRPARDVHQPRRSARDRRARERGGGRVPRRDGRSPLPGVPTGTGPAARSGGAVDVARDLPASTAGGLLDAAGAAFGDAFQVTTGARRRPARHGGGLVVVLLRRIPAG